MAVLTGKTVATVFLVGLFVCTILSFFGMGYLTQMAFSDKTTDGKYCGTVDQTQRDLARLAVVMQWIILCSIVIRSGLKMIWDI
jgi:Mn2+/Fe2+ NRAMP family transporter